MNTSIQSKNKALVLEATLKYEPGPIVADEDLVIVHGRFSGFGTPASWIVADILRIKDGVSSKIGMSFRTRRLESNRRAVGRYSVTRFRCNGEQAVYSSRFVTRDRYE